MASESEASTSTATTPPSLSTPSFTSPPTPLQHDPRTERPLVVGPPSPQAPYPIYLRGKVARGFGRGSKDLGCPTANLPEQSIAPYTKVLETGVHYGYAKVLLGKDGEHEEVWPMVMSVGWNPYYKNERRTAEVHILHDFQQDFYGQDLRVIMLGFIRPEYNYTTLDALIKDIETDKEVTRQSLNREGYQKYSSDPFFLKA